MRVTVRPHISSCGHDAATRRALLDKQLKMTSVGTGLLQCILAGAFAFVL